MSDTTTQAPAAPAARSERIHAIGWIRVLLTILVVAHHTAEPYVSVGAEWQALVGETEVSNLLLALFVFNRTFFMGFFFLISAHFLDASIARHGLAGVAGRRLLRLGLPLVVIVVFVFGALGYAIYGEGQGYITFVWRDYLALGNAEFGHTWFIAHLLVYVLIYLVLRAVIPGLGDIGRNAPPPGHGAIFAFILSVGGVTALVRLNWAIDEWPTLLGFFPAEPAHMPLYVALFATGILAGRAGWFGRLETAVALPWALAALVAFVTFAVWDVPRLAQPDTLAMRMTWAFVEPAIGTGVILGLVVLFRATFSGPSEVLRWLGPNLYGIYLVHLFIVIGLQMALSNVALPALAKFAVILPAALLISLALTILLRLIPGSRRVL